VDPFGDQACIADRYVIEAPLGTGGMGAVYRAFDNAEQRTVALKRLRNAADSPNPPLLRALFEREFHTLVRLKHPHIVAVHDYGVHEGWPFYTMALLEGEDLEQLAPLPYREVCRLMRDVASALAFLHAQRLVHRDVNPRNVRCSAAGRAMLLDFGALSAFGVASELVGAPMCIAPESFHRAPLDQRTDLFALGALAYWSITKRPPYAIHSLRDYPSVWATPPRPPSAIVPGVPPELDALLLSLLKPNPSARPANAAVVIDRLTLIAGLPTDDDHPQAAESYLLSSRMVGRQTEREWVLPKLLDALDGRGSAIAIEGPTGIGRSRLLRESCLDAQLNAMLALSADAQALPGAYAVAINLGQQLLAVAPAIASECAKEHALILAQLSPELREKLDVELAPIAAPPAERRARYRTALHAWFMRIAERLPLVLAVDNLQAADDDSAAVLAGLAREAHSRRLVVIATCRSGDQVVAPDYLAELRRHGERLKLTGLTRAACDEFVKSLFGDVANSSRTAHRLLERSAGNPALCMDLARLMVRKEIVRYVAGTWVLPLDVSDAELPNHARDILSARLAELSPVARMLAETMSIHDKPLPLQTCLSLDPRLNESEVYGALAELVAAQVLAGDGNLYRFEQATLRATLLDQLSEARRRELHSRAAHALLQAAESDVSVRVEAAWHLLRAGDDTGGADLMAQAALEFMTNERTRASIERVIEGLEAALDVYDRQGRSDYEIARLMIPLIPLAFYTNRRVCLKYCERVVKLGLKITGLRVAQRLTLAMPPQRALKLALRIAAARFARQRARGLTYDLKDAITWLCGLVPSALAAPNICYEIETVQRLVEMLAPLRLFGPTHFGTLMHDYARGQMYMGQGREYEARELLARWHTQFSQPSVVTTLGINRWNLMCGGMLFARGILAAYTGGNDALTHAQAMEQLGLQVWVMAADQVRLLHHALRGESERVSHYRERVELHAVQGSSMWQAETFWPVLLLGADALTRDPISTRATWEHLSRRAVEVPALQVYADAAEAIYLAMRGEPERAVAIFERVMPRLPVRGRVAWSTLRAHFAEALIAAGDPTRAKAVLLELLSHVPVEEREIVGRYLEPQRQLALAECALGNVTRAAALIDELLEEYGQADQPLLIGLLHKARAEVALQEQDVVTFERHATELGARFGGTGNPALIAQCERLSEAARAARSEWSERVSGTSLRAASAVASMLPPGPRLRPQANEPEMETQIVRTSDRVRDPE
jgi:hypothetical protein